MGNEGLLRRSVDALDDVVYVYDESGRLAFWNERLNELFDLTDEELAGMAPTEFFLEPDRAGVERAVEEVFEEGETVVEARAETTEGTVRFQLSGHLLTDDDGTVLGFGGVGRDVTDQREQAVQLAAQNDRLSEFAALLAHDVRNPLTVAHAGLDLYETDGDEEHLDRARSSLDRIERIIDDVLTVASDGRAVSETEPVALSAVARDAWTMVETDEATLDVRTTATVEADRDRLGRLFENLFRNAVEHAGPAVTVGVEDTPVGFAVRDDGPGIDAADRETVFDPGYSTVTDGTGFGLYIVETIAEAHGWTVAVTDAGDGDSNESSAADSASPERDRPVSGGRGASLGARFEFTLFPGETDEFCLSR
jgi:PAS domain S-box-containing protein